MVKYYGPSIGLVETLFEELRSVSSNENLPPQSEELRVKNTKAKRKYDFLDRLFQGFLDLVYFLEFLEDHPELLESYDNYLKDLFGISNDDSRYQRHHNKHRGTSLFGRFIMSSLLNRYGYTSEYDFRVPLANLLIFQAIEALQMRILRDNNERKLFLDNTTNAKLWSQLLASRYNEKDPIAHRRIGYCLPFSYSDIQKYNEENNKLG